VNANKGIGRLTKLTDGTGSTEWLYDIQGRVMQKKQTTASLIQTVGYAYDSAGRLASMTYPSGKVVGYGYDAAGQIASVILNGANIATGIVYQPFSAVKTFTFGNASAYARAFDLDGQIASYPLGSAFQGIGYDLGNRITTFTTASAKSFTYDKLDRLTGFVAGTTNLSYQYDADGNRSQFKNGAAISTYSYPATSNKLTAITGSGGESYIYDASGSLIGIGAQTLTYDARARLKTLTSGTSSWSYGVNGLGQRVTKAGTGFTGTLRYVYDEQGHLIGEYGNTGGLTEETIYLGDTPVALNPQGTFYVQADHLNTPRVILNTANQLRWRWDLSEPFGNNAPNENPAGLGAFKYNLRFPGQYADSETGLNYNFFRDYYPKTGGYVETDPLGVAGLLARNQFAGAIESPSADIRRLVSRDSDNVLSDADGTNAVEGLFVPRIDLSLYAYGEGNPLSRSDAMGLAPCPGVGGQSCGAPVKYGGLNPLYPGVCHQCLQRMGHGHSAKRQIRILARNEKAGDE
jgi:RHS repeat-associated protein